MSARGRNLGLLVGAAGLALVAVLAARAVLQADERTLAAKEKQEQLVAPLVQADGGTALVRYDRLVITAGRETTELGRLPDGAWVISRPLHARADTRAAEEVVSALQSARLNRVVEDQAGSADLERYGLQPPRFTVTASADGAPPITVSGGVENPFDGSVYLLRAGDPRVYAVDGATRARLEKTTDALRARDLAGARDLGLVGIELRSDRHAWALNREPDQPWVFVTPAGTPADGAAISQWISGLQQQRAEKFLDDSPAARKRAGLGKPAVEATFRRKDETVRVRLAAGKLGGDPVTLLREDALGATLAEMPRTVLAALDVSPVQLRDRKVLLFEPARVERIRFLPEGGGPALVVQREHLDGGPTDRWLIASRPPEAASTARMGTLLYTLASLRSLPVEEASPGDTGLGATARTVVLEGASGQILATLVLGKPVQRKDRTVWTRNSRGEVVQIDIARLSLPARREDLLEMAPAGLPPPPDAGSAPR